MINDLQDELCETMAETYVYEPFEEYAKQVEVKPLVQIVNQWIRQILIGGVETSEDDKVGEFEKYIRIDLKIRKQFGTALNNQDTNSNRCWMLWTLYYVP